MNLQILTSTPPRQRKPKQPKGPLAVGELVLPEVLTKGVDVDGFVKAVLRGC